MALTDKDREKSAFDNEWQHMVQLGAELSRWKPDIMGPSVEDYRESPAGEHIEATLEEIKHFLENEASRYGLTEANFWMEAKKHSKKENKTAKGADKTFFYEQVETEAERDRSATARQPDAKYKTVKIFRRSLKMLGFLPFKAGKYKGKSTKHLDKMQEPNKFEDLERQIHEKKQELASADSLLAQTRDQIADLKTQLSIADESSEAGIRDELERIQRANSRKVDFQMKISDEFADLENKHVLLLGLIEDELKKEGAVIERKWGQKVDKLLKKKQTIIDLIDRLDKGGKEPEIRDARAKYRENEKALFDVRKEIVNYKVKHPIFLYERFTAVHSIPCLARLAQASSISEGMEMPEVSRPPTKLPRK